MAVLVNKKTEQIVRAVRFNGSSTHSHLIKVWTDGASDVPSEGGVHTQDITTFTVLGKDGPAWVEAGKWVLQDHRGRVEVLSQEDVSAEYILAHDEGFAMGVIESARNLLPYFQDENGYCAIKDHSDADLDSFKLGAIWETLDEGVTTYGDPGTLLLQKELRHTAHEAFERKVLANPELVKKLDAGIAAADRGETTPGARRT